MMDDRSRDFNDMFISSVVMQNGGKVEVVKTKEEEVNYPGIRVKERDQSKLPSVLALGEKGIEYKVKLDSMRLTWGDAWASGLAETMKNQLANSYRRRLLGDDRNEREMAGAQPGLSESTIGESMVKLQINENIDKEIRETVGVEVQEWMADLARQNIPINLYRLSTNYPDGRPLSIINIRVGSDLVGGSNYDSVIRTLATYEDIRTKFGIATKREQLVVYELMDFGSRSGEGPGFRDSISESLGMAYKNDNRILLSPMAHITRNEEGKLVPRLDYGEWMQQMSHEEAHLVDPYDTRETSLVLREGFARMNE